MDTEIATLVAQNAVRRLLSLYCDAVARRDPDAIWDLFTKDAVVTIADGPDRVGPQEIVEGLRGTISKFSFLHQKCDTGLIDVDGERARARINVLEANRSNDADGMNMIFGTYDDEYRLEQEGWRFQRRRFTLQFRAVLAAQELQEFPHFMQRGSFGA
jgi:ketosteroid isomerase-like protein